ncbi:MAG: tRNA guanosine(34) transglycosylase Tgt [Candidatus Neomarinimicrobiota bacterium]
MKFNINNISKSSGARTGVLETDHGYIETPVFMPVGTVGAVKTMSPKELKEIGFKIILGNTYHLYLRPGTNIIKQAGGLHKFISWDRPILTDSGGFQVFSLSKLNNISDDGVEFQSHLDGSRHMFTPEKSMEIQRCIGSDIIMAFDDCPPGGADYANIQKSVERTTNWMIRCSNWLKDNPEFYNHKQTVFPIIQGGIDKELRRISAEQLASKASCGMAIGGLAVGEEKNAMLDTIEYCHTLLPNNQPRYLMGVGRPTDLIESVKRGVDMFDCVMPTRNGRNGHIFTSKGVINIRNEKFKNNHSPIDNQSSHPWGNLFSKSYVRHLFNINEVLGLRIASVLNLAFYNNLMVEIRLNIKNNNFENWSKATLNEMSYLKGM